MDNHDLIRSGIYGVVVGDALGVPVEFTSRLERKNDLVIDMREYGTHSQPKGTWSDDSSMMLATLDSIIHNNAVDYADIMMRFNEWKIDGKYTPHGRVFDIGITCGKAIGRYRPGMDPLECGGTGERDNGNGSLMRIMPASLYVVMNPDLWEKSMNEAVEIIGNISALTHGHLRSKMGCVIYTAICHELMYSKEHSLEEALFHAINSLPLFYNRKSEPEYMEEFEKYERLGNIEVFKSLPEDAVKSGGYVVDTLEAAVWCLLNSASYADCVLKAVNLGDDTDTVGAVAGGLAGLWYGYDDIPKKWLDVIVKKDWINKLCEDFAYIMS